MYNGFDKKYVLMYTIPLFYRITGVFSEYIKNY